MEYAHSFDVHVLGYIQWHMHAIVMCWVIASSMHPVLVCWVISHGICTQFWCVGLYPNLICTLFWCAVRYSPENAHSFNLFVSLLSHFWLIHLFYLHLLYQPYVGLCQATRVQSHHVLGYISHGICTYTVVMCWVISHGICTQLWCVGLYPMEYAHSCDVLGYIPSNMHIILMCCAIFPRVCT